MQVYSTQNTTYLSLPNSFVLGSSAALSNLI